jgi:hypothetical protein
MSTPPSSFRSQLFDAMKLNPRRAILAVAVISVVVSCYPVVFFGRSFVSANSVPMLYPGIPSLPGHDETETENFKGSDAGAIMCHDVPKKSRMIWKPSGARVIRRSRRSSSASIPNTSGGDVFPSCS